MSTIPPGSSILLCPVGPMHGTIDPDDWDFFQTIAAEGSMVFVDLTTTPEVFATWLSNVKSFTDTYVSTRLQTDPPDDPEITTTVLERHQYKTDFATTYIKNESSHPYPLNHSSNVNRLRFPIYANACYEDIAYFDDSEAHEGYGYPHLCIYQDKFYAILSSYNTSYVITDYSIDTNICSVTSEWVGLYETVTHESTYEITSRFY